MGGGQIVKLDHSFNDLENKTSFDRLSLILR